MIYPDTTTLAERFRAVIREWFADEPEILRAIDAQNAEWVRTGQTTCCATHDHCDANEAMVTAWWDVMDAWGDDDGGSVEALDHLAEDERGCAVWNEAWDEAQRLGFSTKVTS